MTVTDSLPGYKPCRPFTLRSRAGLPVPKIATCPSPTLVMIPSVRECECKTCKFGKARQARLGLTVWQVHVLEEEAEGHDRERPGRI